MTGSLRYWISRSVARIWWGEGAREEDVLPGENCGEAEEGGAHGRADPLEDHDKEIEEGRGGSNR